LEWKDERLRLLQLTEFVPPNFFSVAMEAPVRFAAFRADSPRMTFSLGPAAPARTLLPILVTLSHSSDMVIAPRRAVVEKVMEGFV
jgi:hypothetical protein